MQQFVKLKLETSTNFERGPWSIVKLRMGKYYPIRDHTFQPEDSFLWGLIQEDQQYFEGKQIN